MKNKRKSLFIIIYTCLIILLPIGIVGSYNTAKTALVSLQTSDDYYINRNIIDLAYAAAIISDPDYQPIIYTENADEEYIEQTNKFIRSWAQDEYNKYSSDPNLNFTITYNKVLKNNNRADNNIYEETITIKNDQTINSKNIVQHYGYPIFIKNAIYYNGSDSTDYIDSIVPPNNMKLSFQIHQDLVPDGIVFYTINEEVHYLIIAVGYILILTIILGIFIFTYPTVYIEDSLHFKNIKKWKFEILCVLYFTVFLAVGVASMFAIMLTFNYDISTFIPTLSTNQGYAITISLNILMWIIIAIIIASTLFNIKYIFYKGFIKYFKEDTILGNIIIWSKDKLNEITSFDLHDNLHKTILISVAILGAILYLITFMFPFTFFILIFVLIALALWLKRKADTIQTNYFELLNATKQLSQGNLDIEINNDLGVFNSLKDEFNNLKIGFKKAVDEETKSQNMKTELISNVSHDLKTPITCIKNYVYLLEEDNLDEETRKDYIQNLKQYTNRLTVLIEDLFEVSKVNSGNITLNPQDLDIVALLEQCIVETEDQLKEKNLTIIKHTPLDSVTLNLDSDKTYRILENLLSNIAKYSLENSRVYIDLIDTEDSVDIIFKNISQEEMNFSKDEIVERFVRGDKSRHESGSGLGLAIAKSFTEAQNGTFDINIDGDLFKVILTFKK